MATDYTTSEGGQRDAAISQLRTNIHTPCRRHGIRGGTLDTRQIFPKGENLTIFQPGCASKLKRYLHGVRDFRASPHAGVRCPLRLKCPVFFFAFLRLSFLNWYHNLKQTGNHTAAYILRFRLSHMTDCTIIHFFLSIRPHSSWG